MRGALRIGAVLLAGAFAAAFTWQERSGDPVLHQIVDNVVFDLSMTSEGLTACLDTTKGAKLSGQYGIKVTAVSAAEAWDEAMPKTIAVQDDYFQLPLRIDLKRKPGSAEAGKIHFEAAACQAAGICVPVEASFDIVTDAAAPVAPCRS
jgi:putative aminopeptidase FrvX